MDVAARPLNTKSRGYHLQINLKVFMSLPIIATCTAHLLLLELLIHITKNNMKEKQT